MPCESDVASDHSVGNTALLKSNPKFARRQKSNLDVPDPELDVEFDLETAAEERQTEYEDAGHSDRELEATMAGFSGLDDLDVQTREEYRQADF